MNSGGNGPPPKLSDLEGSYLLTDLDSTSRNVSLNSSGVLNTSEPNNSAGTSSRRSAFNSQMLKKKKKKYRSLESDQ